MGKAAKTKKRPVIRNLCSLGTLDGYGGKKGEWSFEKKLKMIRKAGFDGFMGRLAALAPEDVVDAGMIFACTTRIGSVHEIEGKFKRIKGYGAACVNVHLLEAATPVAEALAGARAVMDCGDEMGLDVSIELHRDSCTQTLAKTYALADRYERAAKRLLKLTWDFSHPAVTQRISPPFWIRLAERPDLMQWANQYHFRPFNGHHAQIPALGRDGELAPGFLEYMKFADQCIANWMERSSAGRVLYAGHEQTAGYWLAAFGDRFADAQIVRDHITRSFKTHRKQWSAPADGYPAGV